MPRVEVKTLPVDAGELDTGAGARVACFHCGETCPDGGPRKGEKFFCCQGCLAVHDLLAGSGLGQFYDLNQHPGIRVRTPPKREQWACLDESALQRELLDFTDGRISKVTFHIPAIHCIACIWLLENLFRLHPGIGASRVNYPKREAAITFSAEKIRLSELVALLASIGYEPELTHGGIERSRGNPARKKQWLQMGIAGFAFGNIMLLSIPLYLGLDSDSKLLLARLFGYLSLGLAAPVLFYSASDYWKSAWLAARRSQLTLDVPIALGLAALYAQSAFEVLSGRGVGYLDSMTGLVFFLLCGRVFQQKTHERLAFDRDYKCFFPLSVMRQTPEGEESVAIGDLAVGDQLRLRNGELIPADSRLVSGQGLVDYSFVTGESEPAAKQAGDYLYAGGRQTGGAIVVETVKAVSQSYLTSLWNHESFQKKREDDLNTLTNRYSRRFTRVVIAIAVGSALFWVLSGDSVRGLKAFISVLIVACPCALALAAPFTLGTAQRLMAAARVFLKNALVIERMSHVDAIVFDKTGTLTASGTARVRFVGAEKPGGNGKRERAEAGGAAGLDRETAGWVYALTEHSTHPLSRGISQLLSEEQQAGQAFEFEESPGQGISGRVGGHKLRLGSRAWLEKAGVAVGDGVATAGSSALLAVDGVFLGSFVLENVLRPQMAELVNALSGEYGLAILSGDNERDRERFRELFGPNARLEFNQSPIEKLEFIKRLQGEGRTVMMVGDGLNDAGALRQSDVGVAVVEKVGAFSPASDVVLEAGQVPRLHKMLVLAKRSTGIVRLSFGISAVYNLVGISIAAAGILSPVICAVLMPVSSVSVVLFACGATAWAGRQVGIHR